MKWRHAWNSHLEQAFSSVPKVKKQTDEKAWTVQRQVLRLKLKIPCLLRARWKISSCDYRSTSSRVSWLQDWRNTSIVLQMNTILWKVEELGMNASAGHTWNSQDALGTKLNSVKKEMFLIWSNLEAKTKKVNLIQAKSLRAWFWGTTIWGNLTTSRLYQRPK